MPGQIGSRCSPTAISDQRCYGHVPGFNSTAVKLIAEPGGDIVPADGFWSATNHASAGLTGNVAPTVNPSNAICAFAAPTVWHT